MQRSKLEYILAHIPEDMLADFRQNLESSRRKREEILGQLLSLVKEGELDKTEMYTRLYPGKSFSEKQLRNLRSELFGRLTDFLAIQHFENSPEKRLYVAKSLNAIKATLHFPAILEKYSKEDRELGLSLERMDLDNRMGEELLEHKLAVDGRKQLSLDELLVTTEEAFVGRTLYFALAQLEAGRIHKDSQASPSSLLWEHIKEKLRSGAWSESRLIQMYYGLYLLIQEPDNPTHYISVKSLLTALGGSFEKKEARQMYTLALNHCARLQNRGDDSMAAEIFHLYEEKLEHGLLVGREGMDPWHFKSVVTCALRLGKFDWTRNFLESQGPMLSPRFRENMLNYCEGKLHFFLGDFETAEGKMNRVLEEYSDPFFGLDARSYLLRIYYELGNTRGMDALSNSFRLFLRRHQQLSPERLKNYQEFIRFYRRMVALPPGKPQRANKLRAEISASPYHAGRSWLLEKLNGLVQ